MKKKSRVIRRHRCEVCLEIFRCLSCEAIMLSGDKSSTTPLYSREHFPGSRGPHRRFLCPSCKRNSVKPKRADAQRHARYVRLKERRRARNTCFRCGARLEEAALHCSNCLADMKAYSRERLHYIGEGRGANNRGRAWGNGAPPSPYDLNAEAERRRNSGGER